jgi:cysteinyl-tRNA synthetase, unknown class
MTRLLFAALFGLCLLAGPAVAETVDYRGRMREFVKGISAYAKKTRPGFIVITQNGNELLDTGDKAYLKAIDGVGQEDLFYGYDADDVATPARTAEWLLKCLSPAPGNGLKVLVIDYCSGRRQVDDSYARNKARGFISFAADSRELDRVPSYPAGPFAENGNAVNDLADALNFLYLINPSAIETKGRFLEALSSRDYDLVLTDLFFHESPLMKKDVEGLKKKGNGKRRLVIAYMSIGEAETYRYYWRPEWKENPPRWLAGENPEWEGNFKVRYWDSKWQAVIYGHAGSYLDRILDAGFDGVYLDIIDAFDYFERVRQE